MIRRSTIPTPACRACGASITIGTPVPRDAECPSCGHDVRCCLNCRHHDPRYNNECRETEADPVPDKHRRNFCEYFELNRDPPVAAGTGANAAEARRRLEQLFGGRGGPGAESGGGTREDEARRKLRDLFGEGGTKK